MMFPKLTLPQKKQRTSIKARSKDIDVALDSLFALFIKCRDNWQCVMCQEYFVIPDTVRGDNYAFEQQARGFARKNDSDYLDNSHFHGKKTYPNLKHDEENCDALCRDCHNDIEHDKKGSYAKMKLDQLGQEKFERLRHRRNTYLGTREPDKVHLIKELLDKIYGLGYIIVNLEKYIRYLSG